MDIILHYFPEISSNQIEKFHKAMQLYKGWNEKINVISRKDIDQIATRHFLHSLGIAKIQSFLAGSQILDVGTGGGFPGIPLAILFPETQFYLVDSIGKKIKVVQEIAKEIGLTNVKAEQRRAETIASEFDFIVSRAVTQMPEFVNWVKGKVKKKSVHSLSNGILYLKGGNLSEELKPFSNVTEFQLSDYFTEDFFETKKVIHLPM
ncbi:MAG: 16S rRNA (guanine(527)-N(7))-methyltransferase RsmG [Capnocytophaga sp.]|nr:16S rRNA (guanine(527)-N(7))-methyltransferase RsmG [Capnocytophaga sp.]